MLTVSKTGAVLGARILGLDSSKPVDAATVSRIDRVWLDNEAIFCRGQDLSPEYQIRIGEQPGPVEARAVFDEPK
jgi:taurine dioxygenase